jgi:hypothetical protein
MTLLVASATGAGYGKILAFADNGKPIGVFGDDPHRMVDGLNPGGGNFGPDGRYRYDVGLRGERTIMAFTRELNSAGEYVLPPQVVPFPRGFAFGHDGRLFLASGIGPGGEGDSTILAFDSDRRMIAHGRWEIWRSVPSTLRPHQAVTLLSAASTRSVLRMPRRPSENMIALTGISCGCSSPVMVCGFRSREVCALVGIAGSLVWLKTRSSRSISRLEIASEQL